MKRKNCGEMPNDAAGEKLAAKEILDKRGYAERWSFSPRTIDNFLREGLPHCRIGKRRVRIFVADADAWMRQKFFCQRRGRLNGDTSKAD